MMVKRRFLSVPAGLLIAVLLIAAAPAGAAVVTIDNSTTIAAAISGAAPGDTIILEPGTYFEHDLVIDKTIIIRANTSYGGSATDTIIDAQVLGRIFDNIAGHDLTIDSLTLRNGRAAPGSGGAILQEGGTLTVTRSVFSGCSADDMGSGGGWGGAIGASGTTIIDATTFSGCTATGYGGAIIHTDGSLAINGSAFSDCTGGAGGAVMVASSTAAETLTIGQSLFTRCRATGSSSNTGGALFLGCFGYPLTATISDTEFTDCTADAGGGAIYSTGSTLTINGGSSFSSCSAITGGAVYQEAGSLTVTDTAFSGCSATNGGAIYALHPTTGIADTTFTACTAHYGGAIESLGGTLTITTSVFSGCTASNSGITGGQGGAIFSTGTATITDSAFSGCTAYYDGGAIYMTGNGAISIISSTFTSCTGVFGGAIHLFSGTLTITSSGFTSCPAGYLGGALYNHQGTATITSSTFTGCTADLQSPGSTGSGGAIYNWGTLTIMSSTFSSCSAAGQGGAIANEGTLVMHFSRIVDCGPREVYGGGGSADAENNWWGTSGTPPVVGNVDASPWLVLGITADPASIDTAGTSAIRTNLTYNSDNVAPGGGYVPDDIMNTYAMVSGSGSVSPLTDGTVNGYAQTTYTPVNSETVNISGSVDHETVYIEVPVAQAAPDVTGITPDTGVNTSTIPVMITGTGFMPGSTVRLVRSGTIIAATNITVVSQNLITCDLPITGAEAGYWTVSVTVPRSGGVFIADLVNAFTVTAPSSPPVPTPPPVTPDFRDNDDDWPHLNNPSPATTSGTSAPLMTVTVNIGGDSKAGKATVTGTKLAGLVVTGTVQPVPGPNVTAPPGTIFQYFTLSPAGYGSIANAVINFTVPQSWLDENHIDPKNIVLYRLTASGWEALPTTFLSTKSGTAAFSSRSGGFSLFAIAGTPAGETSVAVAKAPAPIGTPVQLQPPAPVAKAPVTTQTTAPPAPAPAPAGTAPFPLVPVVLGVCCVGLIGSGWYARRWWLHRQNPALFAEYD